MDAFQMVTFENTKHQEKTKCWKLYTGLGPNEVELHCELCLYTCLREAAESDKIELTSVTSSSKEFGKYSYIIRTWNFLNLASQSTTLGNHLSLLFGNHTKVILQMAEHQQMEELLGDKHLEVRGNKKEVTYYLTTERHSLIVLSLIHI